MITYPKLCITLIICVIPNYIREKYLVISAGLLYRQPNFLVASVISKRSVEVTMYFMLTDIHSGNSAYHFVGCRHPSPRLI